MPNNTRVYIGMNRFFKILFILSVSFSLSFGQTLQTKISSILEGAKGITKVGIRIIDSDSGKIIYEKNSREPVTPASTVKLFTTSAALLNLGKGFRFSTLLLTTDNNISDGTIDGDVIIKGLANPFFTSAQLDSMTLMLKELGINRISGNIVGDDSYFDSRYDREKWIKHERSELALPPISSLIMDRNEITLSFIPVKNKSKQFEFSVLPKSNLYHITNNAKITRRRRLPSILVYSRPKKININIGGYIRKRRHAYSYKAFVDNPPLFIADLLYDKLINQGIQVDGGIKVNRYKGKTYLLDKKETALENVIKKTDKESDNFLAEIIFKTLGAQYSHEAGNSFYATQAVYSFLAKAGINSDNIDIVDGSGLSRANKLTALAVTQLLKFVYNDKEIFNTFYSSLSSAGEDGTLESRLAGFGLKGNFHGKTGTLNGVSAVSGYLSANSGKNVIVSILINFNRGGADYWREIQDEIIIQVAKDY